MPTTAEDPRPEYPNLFSPLVLRGLTLPNRVVMAPMSTNLGSTGGAVTAEQIAFYRARASGGTGMIVVEFCCVHGDSGRSEHRQLTLEDTRHVDGHQRLVEAIRSAGSVACLQLQHGGQGAKRALVKGGLPVTASDVRSRRDPSRLIARALTEPEILHLVDCFGHSAALGVQAGYQAVELHGAHGYLLTSFLSPFTNQRDDAFGGDETRRLEFARRVIARVRAAIGERPLIYRLSADEFAPGGLGVEDMARIAPQLVAAGVDALHVSLGLGWTGLDKVIDPMSAPEGWRLPYARRLREAGGVPVIAVGQIRWPATAERALRDGDADLIALGRPLLADPQWAAKARSGATDRIRPCTSCNYCVTMGSGENGRIGCAENPRTGRELEALPRLPDDGVTRHATVVGGGPGGMAAALMLQQAGYRTQLLEGRDHLGGGLIASAAPPHKDKLAWYQRYLEDRLRESDVTCRTGTWADAERLREHPTDLVVLAQGGQAVHLDIPGIDLPQVIDAYGLLMSDGDGASGPGSAPLPAPPARVLVYGGGETGCECAEWLSERGHAVTLVSRSERRDLARAAEPIYRSVLLQRLAANAMVDVRAMNHVTRIEAMADGQGARVSLCDADGQAHVLDCAAVVIAQGRRPDPTLAQALREAGQAHVAIGDARQGGRIGDAVHDAHAAVSAACAALNDVQPLSC